MKEKRFTLQERSWIIYDWANSAYATIMLAAVFAAFFTGMVNDPRGGDYWWSIGTTISVLIVAVMSPFVGAIADYKNHKKKLFTLFWVIGLTFTAYCAIVDDWKFLLIGYIFSHIGFSGSNLLYDSFLPDITKPNRMDKVSGWGYAMGYIGGSTIPFLTSIVLIQFADDLGLGTVNAVKISILLTVAWWGLFSIPFFKNVRQVNYIEKTPDGTIHNVFLNVGSTAKKIFRNKGMFFFIIAYFFYIDGVNTIISLATSYGTVLGLGMLGMILALFVTQIVAFPCSILFARFAEKIGSLRMLMIAVFIYFIICIVGFIMGMIIETAEIPVKLEVLSGMGISVENAGSLTAINQAIFDAGISDSAWNTNPAYTQAIATSTTLFWVLAIMVGTVQGGIQAISRSFFGKLVPPKNAGEFFGFFEIFGKFAAILGPLLYAVIKGATGRASFSILSIITLFAVAFVIMILGRKHMEVNER
jgi:UMF1 family MFS transporter